MLQIYYNNPNYLFGLHGIICNMKFSEFIATHHAFSTSELMKAMDSPASAEQQLRVAVSSGSVERVRRGLLVSNYGRFEGRVIDPYTVLAVSDPEAVLSYHSALQAHGVAHNIGFVCQFRSNSIQTPFEFRGIRYVPCGPVDNIPTTVVRGDSMRRFATTREQTIVDCLGTPSKAGGVEEAVRSVTAFAYINVDALSDIVSNYGPSAAARIGWLLSQKCHDWHVDPAYLETLMSMINMGPYRLGRIPADSSGFSAKWRLMLPDSVAEVESWITRF